MDSLPLFTHQSPDSVVAYRAGGPVTARQFLSDILHLSASLPGGNHVLNVCSDRYLFAVGVAAAMLANKITLLPPAHLPEIVRHLKAFAPDAVCLTDHEPDIDLPKVRFPRFPAPLLSHWNVPGIPRDRRVACVFTSGSTGSPMPHNKSWGHLVRNVRIEADRLGLMDGREYVLVASVPPQHMYGFESSVLVALQSGQAFCAERPFFPADFVSVIGAVPRARVLVSTPIHLRALLVSGMVVPTVDLVVSATAPLEPSLARDIETSLRAPVLEIYGSTETGQMATRRTTQSTEWHLWSGIELIARDGRTWAQGGHIEEPTLLGDLIEIVAADRFRLVGRIEDLVNIAGKRNSLGNLNHQLLAMTGVVDGVFFLHEDAPNAQMSRTRLGALVVAPSLTAADILRHLRERMDPVFLPRPLLLVDHIPRNSTGKLPRSALQSLLERG
ncbi:MAG: AMP-binding protein [Pseudomonadota bacterium]